MTRRKAVIPLAAGVLVVVAIIGSLAVGSALMAPFPRQAPPPPGNLRAESLVLQSASGARLAAWLAVPPSPRGVVVVLHGVRATRADMLPRVELFWRAGYAALAPDLQAHGESTGERITFGYREAQDAEACVRYARHRFPHLKVGVVGVSLGGAALTLAGRFIQPDAAVLEGVYSTIETAVDNRIALHVGALSRLLTPMLTAQVHPRLGVSVDDLRPLEAIKSLRCPVMVISGTDDRYTTAEETRRLHDAANEPKELWLVPGARHVDLHRYDRRGYKTRLLSFFERHLS